MTQPIAGLYDHVANLLDAMGEHPSAVAASLRVEDIRGVRGSALAHPLCRWLIRLVPDLGVVLGRDAVHVFRPGRGPTRQGVTVPMPTPVREFVDRFDDGQYPELELCLGPPLAIAGQDSPVRYLPSPDTMPLPLIPARGSAVVPVRDPAVVPVQGSAVVPVRDPAVVPAQGSAVVIEGKVTSLVEWTGW